MNTETKTKTFTVALAGQPNTGKSTVFNRLTGARQHVGNWPGKTIEKKQELIIFGEIFTTLCIYQGFTVLLQTLRKNVLPEIF